MNLQKFLKGKSFDAYEYFGAHLEGHGVIFRTYAPNAHHISIIGEFNNWQEQPLCKIHPSGVWSTFLDYAHPGQMYKYVIYGNNGRMEHCDPYGFGMELRPGGCSIIRNLSDYVFHDQGWMAKRNRGYKKPINIYELHFGSWKRNGHRWYCYHEIADELISYLIEHGYNYVEFMPLSEHPFDGSWGYQNTGYFAPTSRYGTAAQLMELIDRLHQAGIGAILDFVPVHFAVDAYGLKEYDGTSLYEYPHNEKGLSEWGSYNFNHTRGEVISFLQSAANYWLKEYHFDGLRMDAVSRLIYWNGDQRQGENAPGVQFLKNINKGLHTLHPKAMLIAEDSTAYPGVTKAVKDGGLGFDYKWDMGWTYDTFQYMTRSPYDRAHMPEKVTFSIYYGCNEKYIMAFSHDEVTYRKKTIIDKLYGSYEEKFAQARLLYLYMMTHPGKNLNFMGNELAMFREWNVRREPDWDLLRFQTHNTFHTFLMELNRLYLNQKALWQLDHTYDGFHWMDCHCENKCVFAYTRTGLRTSLLILLNFSNQEAHVYPDLSGSVTMLLHTDWKTYGGHTPRRKKRSFEHKVPPYSGIIYAYKPNQ